MYSYSYDLYNIIVLVDMYTVQKRCVGCWRTRSASGGAVSLWGSGKRCGERKGGTIRSLKTMDLENGVLAGFRCSSSSMGVCHGLYITSHHIVLFFISSLQFLPLGDLDGCPS
jgi:hypothetical protein